ncbi:hypothetical protein JCM19238_2370 [Vibrio ponticus]|nr:hypothetical protein JCM19238_2370 [Vibrio ponticus]
MNGNHRHSGNAAQQIKKTNPFSHTQPTKTDKCIEYSNKKAD